MHQRSPNLLPGSEGLGLFCFQPFDLAGLLASRQVQEGDGGTGWLSRVRVKEGMPIET